MNDRVIQLTLQEIDAEIKLLSDLEDRVKAQKQYVQDLTTELLASLPPEEQKATARILYWTYEKRIHTSSIGEALGVSPANVCSYVGPGVIQTSCRICGSQIEVFILSRQNKNIGFWKHPTYCKSCIEKEREKGEKLKQEYEEERSKRLTNLREMSYSEYLKTEHWYSVRTRALKRANFRCQLCNAANTKLHVHHRTYINRGCEQNNDVIALCEDCHRKFHNIENTAASADTAEATVE